jgi:hypothetical protein
MPYVCFNNYTQMKRVIYIAFVAAGLLTVSCSKENIQPNNVDSDALPVWRSSSDGGSVLLPILTTTVKKTQEDEINVRIEIGSLAEAGLFFWNTMGSVPYILINLLYRSKSY